MKRWMAALALAGSAGLVAGCGGDGADEASRVEAASASGASPRAETTLPAAPADSATASPPVAAGAPAFAVLYPGGTLVGDPVIGTGTAGPGGLLTFTTAADPDAVVAFYRERAEAAGLSSVMAMNQGEARAYGAVKTDAGVNLQVVASPGEAGETSVQLSWSGR